MGRIAELLGQKNWGVDSLDILLLRYDRGRRSRIEKLLDPKEFHLWVEKELLDLGTREEDALKWFSTSSLDNEMPPAVLELVLSATQRWLGSVAERVTQEDRDGRTRSDAGRKGDG